MATLPGVSSSVVPLDELFDEELALLRCGGSYDPAREERERQAEALEREKEALEKKRALWQKAHNRLAEKLAVLDADLEAVEQLLDELVYDKVVADRLAQERAENRGRMG